MNNKTGWGILGFLFIFLCTSATEAQTINNTKLGKGLQFVAPDSSMSVRLGTYFQILYQGVNNTSTENWDDRFLIRRARLRLDGFAFSPKLTYKIEIGLSNSDIGSDTPDKTNNADNIITDAFARWQMTPTLSLVVGQAKVPGNRERLVSSQKMQFVDRSLLNSQFNLDRDAGLQLHHEHQVGNMVLREIGAISMGEGRDITVNNAGGYDYTARFEVLPFGPFKGDGEYVGGDLEREPTPKLALAASYDFNDDASRSRGQLGDFLSAQRDLHTVFVDAMFKYRGFSSMAEFARRKATDGAVIARDEAGNVKETFITGNAFNIQAGYLFPANWEVAGRFTNYDPTAGIGQRNQQQYTLGLSRYIVGHSLKVQSDLSLLQEDKRDDRYQFRLQMEIIL